MLLILLVAGCVYLVSRNADVCINVTSFSVNTFFIKLHEHDFYPVANKHSRRQSDTDILYISLKHDPVIVVNLN